MYQVWSCLLLAASAAILQAPLVNGGFEQGDPGSVPTGWLIPKAVSDAGFSVKSVDQGCRTGARCAMITGVENPPPNRFGNLVQTLPAAGYQMRRIRLRAAIRVEGTGTRAQMWLRLDRADNSMAFLENMDARPITSPTWNTYDIETDVASDVDRIVLGVMLFGPGKAWVDDVTLEATGEVRQDQAEPARPLTSRGLTNLTAFTKLYGYVRFFHPSEQVASADWETFAVEGLRKVEAPASDAELIATLREIFRPVAPSVQIFATGKRPPVVQTARTARIARYKHAGVGLPAIMAGGPGYNIYSSKIERSAAPTDAAAMRPFEAQLVPGITAAVPLALYVNDNDRTLPLAPVPAAPPVITRVAADRATRLAAVVIAWNVFQHFYPYFDVVKTDWPSELSKALSAAATDSPAQFQKTLSRLVAALHDGHGYVGSSTQRAGLMAPLTLAWVEGQWIVTQAGKAKTEGVLPGDRVVSIDGKPVEAVAADLREVTAAATEGLLRSRIASALRVCAPGASKIALELEPFETPRTIRRVQLDCDRPKFKDPEYYPEPRIEKVADLGAGILYVDLDRVGDADWKAAIEKAKLAKAIIFDMRGYPGQPGILALKHLARDTIRSARWNVPSAAKPDRLDFPFDERGWEVKPDPPYFDIPRVFLTDGRAISYAETVMGIVENYKLAEIVGEPTAGTNGNVNPFRLPGGYSVSWTGMKVLKHDGSQHHGIGILPTVPAHRTRRGVAAGRDEILDRGVELLKSKLK
jgi:hypothetical protein